MRQPHSPKVFYGYVDSTGSRLGAPGQDWTSRKTATGTYIITFPPNVRIHAAVANAISASNLYANSVTPFGTNSFSVLTTNGSTAAATDVSFIFIAVGVDV